MPTQPGPTTSAPAAFWAVDAATTLDTLRSNPDGLTEEEAARRLAVQRAADPLRPRRGGVWSEFARQFTQPIVLILLAATGLSLVLGDRVDAVIIAAIVVLSGLLGFWQEHGAAVTVARLLERVQVHVDVRRSGVVVPVSPGDVVPGDVLVLNAGDIVPCDCRVVTAEALQCDESALTGETFPRHKHPDPAPAAAALADRHSALFQGSHVVSGKGTVVAVVTGSATELGRISRDLAERRVHTSFEAGTARFGVLLARVTGILTALILVVNVALGRPVIEAVLFSLALAVGVTPQMLPAIVAVSLSTGARRMARAQVIVRRLDAIEDLGSMDVLCTDKTGTLTEGSITMHAALGADGAPRATVAARAALNAGLQTGFSNPLDEAVLVQLRPAPGWVAVDEVPFDFERKRLTVLLDGPDGRIAVTKGAYATVVDVCSTVAGPGAGPGADTSPIEAARVALDAEFARLSALGYRVLALAERSCPGATAVTVADERAMTFLGFLTFEDPPKQGLRATTADLDHLGIRLCMLTGDNHLAATHVARSIGTAEPRVVTGAELAALDDDQLRALAPSVDAFAELTPSDKERIIEAFRAGGSVVGYLGDGINDAAPLHLADVGISVDTAVDVAKSAASMVLLDKNLQVVVDGVRLGRQTFANTLKYVYTTISANFGNTASMAAASAFLPFLPMLPRQILLLNFLSDLPSVTIAADRVDDEDVRRPRRWDLRQVRNFMVLFGLLSSVFDVTTFVLLLTVFHADAEEFRTGWFVGSALTELAVLFVLRTRRRVWRSTPGRALLVTSVLVAAVTVAIPFVPATLDALGLTRPPVALVGMLLLITCGYVVAAEFAKRSFYRRTDRVPVPPKPFVPPQQRRLEHLARAHGHLGARGGADLPPGRRTSVVPYVILRRRR